MKWPQFELWRLFVATALFGAAISLIRFGVYVDGPSGPAIALLGVLCAWGAFGTPFRRTPHGALLAFVAVLVAGLFIVLFLPVKH